MKTCCQCKKEKELSEFNNLKAAKDGKKYYCRECQKKDYRPKTKEKANRDAKKYALAHPDRVKLFWNRYYSANKDALIRKASERQRTDKGVATRNKSVAKNKDKVNERRRIKRKNPSPKDKMERVLRGRFQKVITRMKRGVKHCSWRPLLGCSVIELKKMLENQFIDGMDWTNHGNGDGKWNVDHIKPLKEFNLFDLEEQKTAFNYTNLRPLWFKDNMARNRKYA